MNLGQTILQQGIFQIDPNATPEDLERRRERVRSLFTNGGQSRSVAEGAVKLAGGVFEGLRNRNARKHESEKRSEANSLFEQIMGATAARSSAPVAPLLGSAPSTLASPEPVSTMPIPDTPEMVGADTRAALGLETAMPASLIRTESSGNLNALNDEVGHGGMRGHGGRGQFGHARLQDAAAAGIIPAGTTPQQFAQMPESVQAAVENWHIADIDRAIERSGAASLIGQDLDGDPSTPDVVTQNGLRAVAHLGGIGGMERFVSTRGGYNPSDSFGTSLGEYLVTHGSADPSAARGAQPTAPNNLQDLMAAMANPWMTPAQKQVISGMIAQQQQAMDPLRQLQIQQAELELERARNPQPGYQTLTPQEVQSLGLEPGSYQRSPDGQISKIGGGGVTVNNNTGSTGNQWGDPPKDTVWLRDGAGNVVTEPDESGRGVRPVAVPIVGGSADTSESDEIKDGRAQVASRTVTTAAQRAREAVGRQDFGATGTSLIGKMPWTDSAEVLRQVEVLKSQAAGSNLQAMRDSSPTGGALGNVTERELTLLQDMSGALNPNSPTFLRDLDDYERTLLETIHGPEAGRRIFEETRGGTSALPSADADGWVTLPSGVRIREAN